MIRSSDATSREIFRDDFSNPGSGWPTGENSDLTGRYVAGEYEVAVKKPGAGFYASRPEYLVGNFGLQVDVHSITGSAPVAAGLIFALSPAGTELISFVVNPQTGQYAIVDDDSSVSRFLAAWTSSTAIRGGVESNLVRIERRDIEVVFKINGTPVQTLHIQHSGDGKTGLAVWHQATAGVATARFDNFLLETLDDDLPRPTATAPKATPTGTGPTPTVTRRTTPSPTSGPRPTPIRSDFTEVALDDDFSHPDSGWRIRHTTTETADYVDGEYHMVNGTSSSTWPVWHPLTVDGFDFEATARLSQADTDFGYGLIFGREDSADLNFYYAYVSPGTAQFGLIYFGNSVKILVEATSLAAIRPGAATNRLRLISDGTQVQFIINDVPATKVDLAIPNGHVGFGVTNFTAKAGVSALFDDARLRVSPGGALINPPVPAYDNLWANDDFSDPAYAHWTEDRSGDAVREYVNGEYHMGVFASGKGVNSVKNIGPSSADVRIDVREEPLSGGALAGLIFLASPNGSHYSLLVDAALGTVALHLQESVRGAYIVPPTEFPAVRRGKDANRLRVVTVDRQYVVIFVNNVRLLSMRPKQWDGLTGFELFNTGTGTGGAHAYFDNFQVRRAPDVVPTLPPTKPTANDPDVVYADDFHDPGTHWPEVGQSRYEDGEFRITTPAGGGGRTVAAPEVFDRLFEYALSVSTRIDGFPHDPAQRRSSGLLFSHLVRDDEGFLFLVDPDRREYALVRLSQGSEQNPGVVNWTFSRAIRPPGQMNRLTLTHDLIDGVSLFINGSLQTVVDLPYALGFSGLTTSQRGTGGFTASFDDFEIRRYPATGPARGGARTPTPLHRGTAPPPVATELPLDLEMTTSDAPAPRVYLPLIARSAAVGESGSAPGAGTSLPPATITPTPVTLPGTGGAALRAGYSNPNALTSVALETGSHEVWTGSDGGGLLRWDTKTGTYSRFTAPRDLPDDRVLALARQADGTLWVGTDNGAVTLAPGGSNFQIVERTPGEPLTGPVTAIHIASDDTPWLGVRSLGVLHRLADKSWELIAAGAAETVKHASSLAVDRSGDLWVGSIGLGVARRSAQSGSWRTYRAEPPTSFTWSNGSLDSATRELRNGPRLAPLGRLDAELIWLGEGCRDLDPPAAVDGKIALFSITVPCTSLSTMLSVLAARGALAAIVFDGSSTFRVSEFFLDSTVSLPGLWIAGADGKALADRLKAGGSVHAVLPERLPTDNVGVIAVATSGARWIGSLATGSGTPGMMNGGTTLVAADDASWRVRSSYRPLEIQDIDPSLTTGEFADPREQVHAIAFNGVGEAWLGTDNGVERLDANLRPIGVPADFSGALVDNRVRALNVAEDGDLWVATADGLGRLADQAKQWSSLKADANLSSNWLQAGAVDRYGDLWSGGGYDAVRYGSTNTGTAPGAEASGLSRLDRAQSTWTRMLDGAVQALYADPLRDLLWVGDATGVTQLDTMTGYNSRENEQPVIWAQVADARPLRIPASESHVSPSAGRLDGEMALWGDLCARSSPLQSVRGKIALAPLDSFACSFETRLLMVQRQGALGLVAYQTVGESFGYHPDFKDSQLTMPVMIIPERDGSRLQQALQRGDKVTGSLRSAPWRPLGQISATDRYDFVTDRRGNLWVGGVDSLDRRSPEGAWTNFHTRNSGLGLLGLNNPGVSAVAVDSHDNKWLGTEKAGAIRLGADNSTWTPFTTASTNGALPNKPITDIAVDPKDNVWFATAGAGIRRLAADLKSWTTFTRDNTGLGGSGGSSGNPGGGGAGSEGAGLPSDNVSVIQPAPDGATWFGTAAGLARLGTDLKTWTTLPTGAPVTTLLFDHLGDLWFGTAGLGLTQLSRRDPGTDCATALPLSPGAVVDSLLANQADIDLYAIHVDKPFSRIELTLPDADNQLDFFLRRSCIGIGSQGRHIGSQGRHIGSQGRHIGAEQRLVFDVLAETGTYYVDVRPRIGTQDKPIPYRLRSGLTPVDLDSRRTLVLTDKSAVRNAFALAADSDEYLDWLEALGSLQADSTVGALVISDLKTETNAAVRDAYTAWLANQDASATNDLANDLARALQAWIWQRKATDMPRLQYVVLAGDDRILPHFRLEVDKPREGTGWLPESSYLDSAGLDPDSTVAAALKDDRILTDDLYGAPPNADGAAGTTPSVSGAAKDLPIPQLAVGRLVERPSAMTKVIDGFLARRGVTTLSASLVAASGAFEDAARVGASALAESGLAASKRAELLGNGWTQLDLQRTLLAEKRDLFFGALPGDHASLALPDDRRLEPDTLRASASPLAGTLAVMLASHSGLNVPGPNHPKKLDWPEAWLAQGASLVAPSGFAYGLDGEAHYGEKLAADFVRLALQGDGRVIGDALVAAKQDYLADAAGIGPFDAATMASFILYGLPMARIEVTTPPAAIGSGLLGASWGPDAAADADVADGRTAGAPAEVGPGIWRVTVTQAVSGLEKKDGPAGSWYAVPGVQPRLVAGAPVQPQLRVDVPELQVAGGGGSSGPSTAFAGAALPLRGVLWTGGKSRQVSGFSPWWLGALATSLGAVAGGPAPSGRWEPAVPVGLRGWRAGEGAGDLLVAGQSGRLFYTAGQLEGGGSLRLFDQLASEEFYSAAEDVTAPEIKDVQVADRAGELEVSTKLEDAGGILKVVAVWTKPGSSEWRAVELTVDGNGTWRGRMPAGASAVVEAVDKAGNVRVDDNGGWLW